MKYILPIILIIAIVSVIVFSGCVSNKTTDDDNSLENSLNELDKTNSQLENSDNQITNDLNEFDESSELTDSELQEIDNDLSELDALLQESDPFEGLN
jgi:outer membrane murein-binding lipoprotein Lpp